MNKISENFTVKNLFNARTGTTTTWTGILPANGVRNISIVSIVSMGNAADLTLTVQTADDNAGTSAADLTVDCPVYKNGVRLADAKAFTEGAVTGTFVYAIEVPASIIPEGKYIGAVLSAGGNADNIITTTAYLDTYYKP